MTLPTGAPLRVEIRRLHAQHVASVRERVDRDDLTDALGRIYREVGQVLVSQRVQPIGPRFARYHSFGELIDLEAGMPVAQPVRPQGDVRPSQLPGGPAARALHVGSYETLEATYTALAAWQEQNRRPASGGPWEVYVTDPTEEPDPDRWRTEVFWPISGR